jgi:hypothetical protein
MFARFIQQASSRFSSMCLCSNILIHPKQVADTRPPGMRPNYTDASLVAKYELPPSEYEKRDDSVLAWKKANKLGRFDPVCIFVSKSFPFCRIILVPGRRYFESITEYKLKPDYNPPGSLLATSGSADFGSHRMPPPSSRRNSKLMIEKSGIGVLKLEGDAGLVARMRREERSCMLVKWNRSLEVLGSGLV